MSSHEGHLIKNDAFSITHSLIKSRYTSTSKWLFTCNVFDVFLNNFNFYCYALEDLSNMPGWLNLGGNLGNIFRYVYMYDVFLY